MATELAAAVNRYLDAQGGGEGLIATPIDALTLIRSAAATLPSHSMYRSALCVVVQGAKQVSCGSKVLDYDELQCLIISLASGASVSGAAYQVGYESASQFSREYSRMFGAAPKRDALERKAVVA